MTTLNILSSKEGFFSIDTSLLVKTLWMGDDLFSAGLSTKTSSKTFSGNNTTTVVRVFICEGKPASYPAWRHCLYGEGAGQVVVIMMKIVMSSLSQWSSSSSSSSMVKEQGRSSSSSRASSSSSPLWWRWSCHQHHNDHHHNALQSLQWFRQGLANSLMALGLEGTAVDQRYIALKITNFIECSWQKWHWSWQS